MTEIWKAFGIVAGTCAAGALLSMYQGAVLWLLWGWFMVPLGVVHIGIAWAIGLGVIVNLVAPTSPPAPDDKAKMQLGVVLSKPAFALAIGYIAKQFM